MVVNRGDTFQFVTTASDSQLLVWDISEFLNTIHSLRSQQPGIFSPSDNTTSSTTTTINEGASPIGDTHNWVSAVGEQYDLKWKPILRIPLKPPFNYQQLMNGKSNATTPPPPIPISNNAHSLTSSRVVTGRASSSSSTAWKTFTISQTCFLNIDNHFKVFCTTQVSKSSFHFLFYIRILTF